MCHIKNWQEYQHYKNRRPPWIKLHRSLLDDADYAALDPKSAKLLPLIWLIASESTDGQIPGPKALAWRLRIAEKEASKALADCAHWIEQDASTMLADCKQDASTMLAPRALAREETETEGETDQKPPIAPLGGPDVSEVIADLNQVASKKFKSTPDVNKLIHARIAEGFTLADFRTVHRNMTRAWKGQEMEKYLRPSTLYRASKFQGYLNYTENKPLSCRTVSFAVEGDHGF